MMRHLIVTPLLALLAACTPAKDVPDAPRDLPPDAAPGALVAADQGGGAAAASDMGAPPAEIYTHRHSVDFTGREEHKLKRFRVTDRLEVSVADDKKLEYKLLLNGFDKVRCEVDGVALYKSKNTWEYERPSESCKLIFRRISGSYYVEDEDQRCCGKYIRKLTELKPEVDEDDDADMGDGDEG